MKAGRLRDRVRIDTRTTTKDAKGGNETAWIPGAKPVPAEINGMTGGTRDATGAGGGEYQFGMHEVWMRRRALSRTQHRLVVVGGRLDGVVLEILDMRQPGRHRDAMVLTCKEGVRHG